MTCWFSRWTVKIKPDRRPQFLAAVEDDAHPRYATRRCLRFEVVQNTSDQTPTNLVEVYRDEARGGRASRDPPLRPVGEGSEEFLAEPLTVVQGRTSCRWLFS